MEDDSSLDARYEREYVNLLSDMRIHIDKHRQERPNHKIPQTMLLNLFTRVQGQQRKGRRGGDRPKGSKNKKKGPSSSDSDDDDVAAAAAAAPVLTTTPKPR